MYEVEAGCFQKQDKKAIRELIDKIATHAGIACRIETPGDKAHILIDRTFDTKEAALKTANMIQEKCQIDAKIVKLC